MVYYHAHYHYHDHYHASYDSQERWRLTALKSVQQMLISLLGRTPTSLRLDDDDGDDDEDPHAHDGYDDAFSE